MADAQALRNDADWLVHANLSYDITDKAQLNGCARHLFDALRSVFRGSGNMFIPQSIALEPSLENGQFLNVTF